MGIRRTYMAVFELHLKNEMLIQFEMLTRLLRDTIHFTCIRKMTQNDVFYHPPSYHLNGVYFANTMEETRKY